MITNDTEDALASPAIIATGADSLGYNDPLRSARAAVKEQTPPVYKFVLTGGPCAGKTTALTRMSQFYRGKGFLVFTVPEAATSLFNNGVSLEALGDPATRFAFQWSILSLQITLEDGFERVARMSGKPSILFCDRGLMDGSVYMPPEEWASLVKANGLDELKLRDGRYDAVLHLVTAACEAEEHYSLDNNEARSEHAELARDVRVPQLCCEVILDVRLLYPYKVDKRTEAVWLGHPRHFIFDNSTDFEPKLDRVTAAVSRLVGLPCRPRKLGKFLLAQPPPPPEEFPVRTEAFEVEKIFIQRKGVGENDGRAVEIIPEIDGPASCISSESFLEKRGRKGLFVYEMTTISSYDDSTVAEVTRRLSAREYEAIDSQKGDQARQKVSQLRVSFLWASQAFELQTDVKPAYGTSVLYRRSEAWQHVQMTVLSCTARYLIEYAGRSSLELSELLVKRNHC